MAARETTSRDCVAGARSTIPGVIGAQGVHPTARVALPAGRLATHLQKGQRVLASVRTVDKRTRGQAGSRARRRIRPAVPAVVHMKEQQTADRARQLQVVCVTPLQEPRSHSFSFGDGSAREAQRAPCGQADIRLRRCAGCRACSRRNLTLCG